MLFLKFDVT